MSPGVVLNPRLKKVGAYIPQLSCPLGGMSLRECFRPWLPELPQRVWVPVTHSGSWLDNTLFMDCLLEFLSHFPKPLLAFPTCTLILALASSGETQTKALTLQRTWKLIKSHRTNSYPAVPAVDNSPIEEPQSTICIQTLIFPYLLFSPPSTMFSMPMIDFFFPSSQ